MEKVCLLTLAVISLILMLGGAVSADEVLFKYPYYLLDAYDPHGNCWKGIDANGDFQVLVVLEQWLVGPPPSAQSAVTMPFDHWIELKFPGRLVDGDGNDIFLIEFGRRGEEADVFLTDGAGSEYLIGTATASDAGGHLPTEIGFDISGISLPFVPSAIRVLGLDEGGDSPGFDLNSVRARVHISEGDAASKPIPSDGAKNVPADAVLAWSRGRYADKHTVYFGTALTDVDENAVPVSYPPQPQDANIYDPCGLELSRPYFWRIDEVNGPNTWEGNIWSFTVADYLVVDDFGSYNATTIYDAWRPDGDGYIYLSTASEPAHECDQSMKIWYSSYNDYYSEAVRTYSPAQDWDAIGAEVLQLFFYGTSDNDANVLMSLTVSDGVVDAVVPYPGDANDIRNESWQQWNIELGDFNDVNFANVTNITIGFGDGTPPTGIGEGTVYFDDIRLYPSGCLEERPAADFNVDCIVDFKDLRIMAQSWLYFNVPIAFPTDLYDDDRINFKDFAVLASYWLD
ncbi:MAG: hypothetical protein ACYS21_02970 [Planctomycetota bacterium]|jgi:hypothetical protein